MIHVGTSVFGGPDYCYGDQPDVAADVLEFHVIYLANNQEKSKYLYVPTLIQPSNGVNSASKRHE